MATYSRTFAWVRRLKAADYRRRLRLTRCLLAVVLYYHGKQSPHQGWTWTAPSPPKGRA